MNTLSLRLGPTCRETQEDSPPKRSTVRPHLIAVSTWLKQVQQQQPHQRWGDTGHHSGYKNSHPQLTRLLWMLRNDYQDRRVHGVQASVETYSMQSVDKCQPPMDICQLPLDLVPMLLIAHCIATVSTLTHKDTSPNIMMSRPPKGAF